jgi:hypothetical protein
LFHEINFEGVQDCTEGGKSDVRCNNINVTYGYAKQGFQSQVNKDGLHSPLILKNTKTNCNNFSSLMKLSLFEQNNLDCCGILFDSDIRPSNVLAEHSLGYDLAGKLHSNFFVVHAHPNIFVFDSLSTHSLLSVLEKHGNAVPLVAELASAMFLTNGNDKVYQAFWHLHVEELEMLLKENLTMYFANWCNGEFGSIFSSGKFQ